MKDELVTDYTVELPHPKPTHSIETITQTVSTVHSAVSAAICKLCYHFVNISIIACRTVPRRFVNVAVNTALLYPMLLYVNIAAMCKHCFYYVQMLLLLLCAADAVCCRGMCANVAAAVSKHYCYHVCIKVVGILRMYITSVSASVIVCKHCCHCV